MSYSDQLFVPSSQSRNAQTPKPACSTSGLFNLALYHLAVGNAAAAEQLYNEALTAPPNYLREAIQDLDDFLQLFPEHGQALRVRALLQDKLDT